MPWNGSGSVTLTQDFVADAAAGPPASAISSTKMMDVLDDIGAMIAACINKNGENSPTVNISWNSKRITSLGSATAPTDAINANQVSTGAAIYCGTTTGSANAHAASNVLCTSLATGQVIRCLAGYTNSAAATFTYNAGSALAIKIYDGSTDIPPNSIVAGRFFDLLYDGTAYRLLNGNSGQVLTALVIGGTAIASVLELRATSGVGAGSEMVKLTGGNNGATEFARFLAEGMTLPTGAKLQLTDSPVVGNTGAGAVVAEIRTTSGVGSGDYHKFTGGNNGATEFLRVYSNGQSGLNTTPGGRLTLTTATPVMTANTTAQTTIYYTQYAHQYVPIYDGTRFINTNIGAELSQATTDNTKSPAACTTNSNYDLFVWNDSGTLRCTRGPAWSSDTSRGTGAGTTELQRINGIYTNKNAITNGPGANLGTYVGTIRTNGSSQVDWNISASGTTTATLATIGVWNMYNRVEVVAASGDTTASHTYNSTTIRARNGNTNNARVQFVSGLAEDALSVANNMSASGTVTASQRATIGWALDSTTVYTQFPGRTMDSTASVCWVETVGTAQAQLGFHYISALESCQAAVSMTFYDADGLLTVRWRA